MQDGSPGAVARAATAAMASMGSAGVEAAATAGEGAVTDGAAADGAVEAFLTSARSLGHFANHPPPGAGASIIFFELPAAWLGSRDHLSTLRLSHLPVRPVDSPPPDRLMLLASLRACRDEELFVDYGASGALPSWYRGPFEDPRCLAKQAAVELPSWKVQGVPPP